jgi:diketogulonate reductase-like aldo/keto reductase
VKDLPLLIYGTAWKEDRTAGLVTLALAQGFRAIDTANQRKHYHEAAVGEAVRAAIGKGLVKRGELFLQTKFTYARGQDHRLPYDPQAPVGEQVRQSFASSLEHLGTDYVDAYVLHGPEAGLGPTANDYEVWATMEGLHATGAARQLGISNVSAKLLERLWTDAVVRPAFVQNRCYARIGWDREVRSFCKRHGIVYQGFSLLTANRDEVGRPELRARAAAKGCSVPALVFAIARHAGIWPLTGTTSEQHMRDDLASSSLVVDDDDVRAFSEGIGLP